MALKVLNKNNSAKKLRNDNSNRNINITQKSRQRDRTQDI
jgi:hypothetical protein